MREQIQTKHAPAAIGAYSQGIKVNQTMYLAGQIPLDPDSMQLVEGDIKQQVIRVFENIKAVIQQGGGSLDQIVKLTVYLIDLSAIGVVNEVIAEYFAKPYPARTAIQVSALPKGASIEIEAIVAL